MSDQMREAVVSTTDQFSTDPEGLPECRPPETVELSSGDAFDLEIGAVSKQLGDATCGCSPTTARSPARRCRSSRDRRSPCNVTNDGDVETTVHWHGLRLENRYDGVPHETQPPIPIGGSFTYQVAVPRRRLLLVPPAHPRGLRPGDGPVRHHHRRARRRRLLAAGRPAADPHPGRPARRGRARSRRSAGPARTSPRWAGSATSC